MDDKNAEFERKREENHIKATEHNLKLLSKYPSIKVIGVQDIKVLDYMPSPKNSPDAWTKLDEIITNDKIKVSEWVISILKQQKVTGNYLLQFDDMGVPGSRSWINVYITENYDWVTPIFINCSCFNLWNFDEHYLLEFGAEEEWCVYKAKMLARPRPWQGPDSDWTRTGEYGE
ncbi:MAG TPA: hypothetical protein VHL11_16210 [Phototrophicaceae bacterium]|jgi:hypothetical protein|nr:hypothetical protein [Phototrophicaceae bacterium]